MSHSNILSQKEEYDKDKLSGSKIHESQEEKRRKKGQQKTQVENIEKLKKKDQHSTTNDIT